MDGINKVKPVKTPFLKTVKRHWILLLMLLPAVLYVVIFSYIPMTGVVLAFKNITIMAEFIFHPGMVSITLRH